MATCSTVPGPGDEATWPPFSGHPNDPRNPYDWEDFQDDEDDPEDE
jgi:hypothetical protein